jgi:glycosyltransferase involved in cell wall biosynthesis
VTTPRSIASRRDCQEKPVPDLGEVTVVIPALNEAASLPYVLLDLPRVQRVIVVDNGSTDDTSVVALAHGAEVVHEKSHSLPPPHRKEQNQRDSFGARSWPG